MSLCLVFEEGGLLRVPDEHRRLNHDVMMESIRNGKGSLNYIRDLNITLSRAETVHLRGHAPPGTTFECLEGALVEAGEKHFVRDQSARPG